MNFKFTQPAVTEYLNRCAGIGTAIENKDRAEFVLKMLAFQEFRTDKYPSFARVLSQQLNDATLKRDWQFFIRMGRVLDRPAEKFWDYVKRDNLPGLLVAFWENPINGTDGARFCDLSDDVVRDVAAFLLDDADLTLDAVRQARRRLGLPKTEPKFRQFRKTQTGFRIMP